MAILRQKRATPAGDSYRTPEWMLQYLTTEFRWDYDPCPFNPKFNPSVDENGLLTDWSGKIVYCNPPYSNILPWVQKALASKCCTVFLVPARTDTPWFRLLLDAKAEIRFLRKRVDFLSVDGMKKHPAEASLLVVVRKLVAPSA
jgi:phage N-6-adenine-methyltransferase